MSSIPDNCIYVGDKPTMKYVFSMTTQAQTQAQIMIMAWGKYISKAVDVSQIAVNRFLNNMWSVQRVDIGTKMREAENGYKERFSFIEIEVAKDEYSMLKA